MTFRWQPPTRPDWVRKFNDHASFIEDAALVSLNPEDLLETAMAATGLSNFGDEDGWRTHFSAFMESVDRECRFHLLGRTLTRVDILRTLENRLQLTDLWTRRPEILDASVPEPLFIVGAARSGTSILHELFCLDPDHTAPTTWKVHHPVAAATGDSAARDRARRSTDSVVRFWHDVQPEYETMHYNHGDLPTECIFITLPTFLSDNWSGTHTAPSYDLHLATADLTAAYVWHKKNLQTLQLQTRQPDETASRWVLKAPSHLPSLRELFAVYPDARVIHVHRDPARTLASMFALMGTLKWMRTDHVDIEPFIRPATHGIAHLQHRAIADRANGTLPTDRFHDLAYADLISDPVAAIRNAYAQFGWDFDDNMSDAITTYLAEKPKGSKGQHRYELEDFDLTRDEVHEIYGDYIAHHQITTEG